MQASLEGLREGVTRRLGSFVLQDRASGAQLSTPGSSAGSGALQEAPIMMYCVLSQCYAMMNARVTGMPARDS